MENYNLIDKTLHRIFFRSNIIQKSLFDLEKLIFHEKKNYNFLENHIFISGLPRCGTTIFLQYVYNSNFFSSLTYKNMPFLTAPNLFKLFFKSTKIKSIKRVHNDGLRYDLNSPEAFDQVFLELFDNKELVSSYREYVFLICKFYDKKRYLSKNNYNYKRISLIKKAFPNSKILILFREPLQHAFSLLNQHTHFKRLQRINPFVLEYMNFLGHHEFGLNYKFWNKPKFFLNQNKIDHWLEQWLMFYQNILDFKNNNNSFILISYEDLCNKNNLQNLKNFLNLPLSYEKNIFKNMKKKIKLNFDYDNYLKCTIVYEKLKKKSLFEI